MDFGQVIQKTHAACFNSSQRNQHHFVEVTETVPRRRQLGSRRPNGERASMTHGVFDPGILEEHLWHQQIVHPSLHR